MPASGRFLLDTNIVIALFEGDEAVVANLDLASEVFVPAITVRRPSAMLGGKCGQP